MWKAVLPWLRQGLDLLLLPGGVPEHVAFIMDGNRRFATKEHIGKLEGHTMGYGKMVDVIHWCLELGVRYISVYAFSIDNFQRSPEEVGALMHLAEEKYRELAAEDGLAERKGVEMRILGALDLAPPSVRGAAARLMQATAALKEKRAVLNICFSYTSTEEWAAAVGEVQGAVQGGSLSPSDVTAQLIHRCLRTQECPPVDLLIRTSGETRLSDFLLWQVSHAQLCFVPTLWPDLRFLDFAQCILQYQLNRGHQQRLRHAASVALARGSSTQQQQQQDPIQHLQKSQQQQQQQQQWGASDGSPSSSLEPQQGHHAHQHWEPVSPYRWASHPGVAAVQAGGRHLLMWLTGLRQRGQSTREVTAQQGHHRDSAPDKQASPQLVGFRTGVMSAAAAGTPAMAQAAGGQQHINGLAAKQEEEVMVNGTCDGCCTPVVQSPAPSSTVTTPPDSSPSSTRSSTSADGVGPAGFLSSPALSPVCCGLEDNRLASVHSSPGAVPAAAAVLLRKQTGVDGCVMGNSSSRCDVELQEHQGVHHAGDDSSVETVCLRDSSEQAPEPAHTIAQGTHMTAVSGVDSAAARALHQCSICGHNSRVRALLTQQWQHQLDWVAANVCHGQD